jgi:hypothetical protein
VTDTAPDAAPDTPPRWAELTERIGSSVRAELARERRSRDWLANAIGMTPRTLDRRLDGEGEWRVSEVVAIADALDMSVADLLGDPTPRPGQP